MKVDLLRAGDVLRLERRAVAVAPDSEYEEIGIRSFGRGIFHKEPVSGASLGNKRVFSIEPNDLVISNVFAWEGAIAIASDAEKGKIGSHRFMTFVPADRRITTSWAAWFFRSEHGLELIRKASPGSAGRNRTLAIDRFEALQIPVPRREDQIQVTRWLDGVEATAASLGQLSDRARELCDALAVSIVLRRDLDDTTKTRGGWRLEPLGELMDLAIVEVPVEPEVQYPVAGLYSFGRGLIDRGVVEGAAMSYSTLHRLTADNVVLSKLGAWEGAVAVVDPAFDGYLVSTEYPTFEIDTSQLVPAFFAGIVRAPSFWSDLNAGTQGSMVRRKRINAAKFLATEVELPPVELQHQAARAIKQAASSAEARVEARSRMDALVPAAVNEVFSSLG